MRRTKFYFVISLAMIVISCGKVEPFEPNIDPGSSGITGEQKLLSIEGRRELNSFYEKGQDYIFCLFSDNPTEDDTVCVNKSCISMVSDATKYVHVCFKDGKSIDLKFHSWLKATLSSTTLFFSERKDSAVLEYSVESSSGNVSVSIVGADEVLENEIIRGANKAQGSIKFKLVSGASSLRLNFTVRFESADKSVDIPMTSVLDDLRFSDGTVDKEFTFREYERYFELRMDKADKTVSVSVSPESSSWLQAGVSNVRVDGSDYTYICFLVSENRENWERKGNVRVCHEGSESYLDVTVNQIAANSKKSLRNALASFFNSLNGNDWNENDGWCTDRPLFEWHGITASNVTSKAFFGENGYAYFGTDDKWAIELSANNMRGTIPDEFWKAADCFSIIRITDEYIPEAQVPDYFWNGNLETLDLSMSFINVPLGPQIAGASNLVSLSLQSCNVACPFPSEITRLSSLKELNLRECHLYGTLPESLGNMRDLQVFLLDHNMDLGGKLPQSFYYLSSLRIFDISSTAIGGRLTSDIARLSNLEYFNIDGCEFTGTIPEEFGTLKKLSVYEFNGNYFKAIPQFVRYIGFNSYPDKQWVGSAGFPLGVPFYQRDESTGRPDNYVVTVKDAFEIPYILVDGRPLKRPGYYVDYEKCKMLPFPVWANKKYGMYDWVSYRDGEAKFPSYPHADDLQCPADEYYFDGKHWRHPQLSHPAGEYFFNGKEWVHDASCPWDKEYDASILGGVS